MIKHYYCGYMILFIFRYCMVLVVLILLKQLKISLLNIMMLIKVSTGVMLFTVM